MRRATYGFESVVGLDCLDGPLPGAHRHLAARRRQVPDLAAGRGGAAGIGGRAGAGRTPLAAADRHAVAEDVGWSLGSPELEQLSPRVATSRAEATSTRSRQRTSWSGFAGEERVAVDLVGPRLVLAGRAAEGIGRRPDLDADEADVLRHHVVPDDLAVVTDLPGGVEAV